MYSARTASAEAARRLDMLADRCVHSPLVKCAKVVPGLRNDVGRRRSTLGFRPVRTQPGVSSQASQPLSRSGQNDPDVRITLGKTTQLRSTPSGKSDRATAGPQSSGRLRGTGRAAPAAVLQPDEDRRHHGRALLRWVTEGRATAPSPGHSTPAKTLILNAVSTTPSGGEVVSTHPSRG
jgi:hypothetical protein